MPGRVKVLVPVIFLLSADEVRQILAHSGPKVLFTSPELVWKAEGWTGPTVLVGGETPGAIAYEALVAREPDAFSPVERADTDLAVVLYTAGTTGQPKGVALSHGNLASNARAVAGLYELDRTAWALAVLPLSHSYGLSTVGAGPGPHSPMVPRGE